MCAVALLALVACGGSGATSSSSPSAKASATTGGASKLDAEVPMPAGFPADVPAYPGARLTAAAQFPSTGLTAWGVEWETLDSVDKVQAFYASRLSQGDWSIQFSGSANGMFSVVFSRKSNSRSAGTVAVESSSGVTKISMSLANPA